jgi:DNA ligase-associated metallophosphoesterase
MISAPYPIIIRDQQLWLSHHRCIYWEDKKVLILSDTHFSKTGHFRKEGIGLPQGIFNDDLKRFVNIIQYFNPEKVIIVGDLFHSYQNKEIEQFYKLRREAIDIPLVLVKGNHDVLSNKYYKELNIEYHETSLQLSPFSFTHDIQTIKEKSDLYYFTGHIHPGVQIKSKAKQSVRLPCFYFKDDFSYLPAFSLFTGTVSINKKHGDAIFMITKDNLIPLQ